jgi:hypothetical protein
VARLIRVLVINGTCLQSEHTRCLGQSIPDWFFRVDFQPLPRHHHGAMVSQVRATIRLGYLAIDGRTSHHHHVDLGMGILPG